MRPSALVPSATCNERVDEVYVHVFVGILLWKLKVIRSPEEAVQIEDGKESQTNGYPDADPAQGHCPEGCCYAPS
jgi:hypothetical protein